MRRIMTAGILPAVGIFGTLCRKMYSSYLYKPPFRVYNG